MEFFIQLVINGLMLGMVYALIAIGLSLIFGVLEIVNFAHGHFYMLGATVLAALVTSAGIGFFPSLVIATVAVGVVGYLVYVVLLRHFREGEFDRGIILTIGIGMVLQNGVAYLFGSSSRMVDTSLSFVSWDVAGFFVDAQRTVAVLVGAVAIAALYAVLTFTRIGKAMRAFAQNREAAFIVGIRPAVIAGIAVAIGIALAGLAGAALAPVFAVHPAMGAPILFKVFAIIIIGGLGSLPGALVASLLIGVTESVVGGYSSVALQDAVAFMLMIVVLLAFPAGLFGKGIRV
ncbi:branched-chain amino acid ABC transporter permease [Manganibacter manganicus]|uniref:Amino acid ABC transporter n=1 Tax=Manganibacter manganicus TaxID=1873176 RepID=A0A1V8RLL1_9HYPH|nr:branched-chain amino acid ABC transporter permease [Pseudaminobacter manganicus]OQM74087.1 amino acid ABC transporter [Pseudaminobacter manganicus]